MLNQNIKIYQNKNENDEKSPESVTPALRENNSYWSSLTRIKDVVLEYTVANTWYIINT